MTIDNASIDFHPGPSGHKVVAGKIPQLAVLHFETRLIGKKNYFGYENTLRLHPHASIGLLRPRELLTLINWYCNELLKETWATYYTGGFTPCLSFIPATWYGNPSYNNPLADRSCQWPLALFESCVYSLMLTIMPALSTVHLNSLPYSGQMLITFFIHKESAVCSAFSIWLNSLHSTID